MVTEAEPHPQVVAVAESIASGEANPPKGVAALFRIFRFYLQQMRNGRRRTST